MIEQTIVRTVTIDSIVDEDDMNKNVLFKVDVEGYEDHRLKTNLSGHSCDLSSRPLIKDKSFWTLM